MRCNNIAKYYVHWPGNKPTAACVPCTDNALTIARGYDVDIMIGVIPYDGEGQDESYSKDPKGEIH